MLTLHHTRQAAQEVGHRQLRSNHVHFALNGLPGGLVQHIYFSYWPDTTRLVGRHRKLQRSPLILTGLL